MLNTGVYGKSLPALTVAGALLSIGINQAGAALPAPGPTETDDPYDEAIECMENTRLNYFTVSRTNIDPGESVDFTWSVQRPSGCSSMSFQLAGSNVPLAGSKTVIPYNPTPYPKTKTYRLRALMLGGETTLGSKSINIGGRAEPPFESDTVPDVCYNCARPPAGWNFDVDDDGIPDRLEYDLAHRFFPGIKMDDNPVDMDEAYLYNNHAIPYTVEPVDSVNSCSYDEADPSDGPKCLEIRFGIAYHYDHGIPILPFGDHVGDSEFYAALVRRTSSWADAGLDVNNWLMFSDFTAAHWGEGFFDHSKVEMYSTPKSSAVMVYASQKKHALYHSQSDCAAAFEDCVQFWGFYNMRWDKSGKLQNVGNSENHDRVDTSIQYPDSAFGGYRVWDGESFGAASPYKEHFTKVIPWTISGGGACVDCGGGTGGSWDPNNPPTHQP